MSEPDSQFSSSRPREHRCAAVSTAPLVHPPVLGLLRDLILVFAESARELEDAAVLLPPGASFTVRALVRDRDRFQRELAVELDRLGDSRPCPLAGRPGEPRDRHPSLSLGSRESLDLVLALHARETARLQELDARVARLEDELGAELRRDLARLRCELRRDCLLLEALACGLCTAPASPSP